jgi:hypothetical protein
MRRLASILILLGSMAVSQAQPALTIYNQDFAVVRDTVKLNLSNGVSQVNYAGATARLEPDSVILRDTRGQSGWRVLEQNYRADAVSQGLLLSIFEGKTIDFQSERLLGDRTTQQIVRGKIIRSGFKEENSQPIVEVDGKLMFRLPGEPLFPALPDDTILQPTLTWQIQSDHAGTAEAELGYITEGLSWKADYNLVAPETGNTLDLVGWVTMDNKCGKTFENAKIKLMVGDVNRMQSPEVSTGLRFVTASMPAGAFPPPVTEKTFDEYHLYTLDQPATLRDRETKQVQFVEAEGIASRPIYIYDGANLEGQDTGDDSNRDSRNYGTSANTKIKVMREFYNSETNHLGIPLPKGRMRFYRRDADQQLEFIGEDNIDHTPRDEMIRVTMGNAFDLKGERKRTNFKRNGKQHFIDESFEIKLRNHKKSPVEIRVVEHLYRWHTWEVTDSSDPYSKKDSRTVEFPITVVPDGEKTLTYTVHYSW